MPRPSMRHPDFKLSADWCRVAGGDTAEERAMTRAGHYVFKQNKKANASANA